MSAPATDPLVLYGLSGSGKTSVLAKCASLVHSWLSTQSPVVIIRFLGTVCYIIHSDKFAKALSDCFLQLINTSSMIVQHHGTR